MAYTTIDNPELFFQTLIWTGDGSGTKSFTLDGSENMQPDWVWSKARDSLGSITGNHFLYDSVRGAGVEKELSSNSTGAEGANANHQYGYISSFNSNGFTTTAGSSNNDYFNKSSVKYASWNWISGTSFTNDASSTGIGTIDSTGSANDTAGFSIVTYTGNGTSGAEVKHGLSSALGVLIVKSRSEARNWGVFHQSNGGTKNLSLDTTDAVEVNAGRWNNTAPTSSVFTLGNSTPVNNNGITYVAYCFAEKKGYSKFGSYTGNGNADGTFVYTGFKPAWVMVKRTDSGNSWCIFDNKRPGFNETNQYLLAEDSRAELTDMGFEILSNGFKLRQTFNSVNGSGASYIYLAFAESSFVNSNGVPNNAR